MMECCVHFNKLRSYISQTYEMSSKILGSFQKRHQTDRPEDKLTDGPTYQQTEKVTYRRSVPSL